MDVFSHPRFLPAIICAEFDSPIDALLSLHVPQEEAMDAVVAAWHGGGAWWQLLMADVRSPPFAWKAAVGPDATRSRRMCARAFRWPNVSYENSSNADVEGVSGFCISELS